MANTSGDEEIKVSLTADHSDLDEGMEEGVEAVTTGSQTMADAVAESAAAMTKSYEEIIAAQNRSMAQTSAMIAAENEAAAAAKATTASVEGQTAATAELGVVSAGVARELGVLTGEAIRGNFARMEGSVVTLANRLGLMQAVFTPTGLAIGGVAAAIAGFTYEAFKGAEQSDEFNKSLINSGGYLGVTEGQFNNLAQSIARGETTIGAAREALQDFANTGRLGGTELQTAGQAAVDFSALTGQSMDKAVAAILKLEGDPVKALLALNQQYHFLTEAQLEHIQKLEDEGSKTEAASEAVKLFGDTEHQRVTQADEDAGSLVRAWRAVKAAISDAGNAIQGIGRNKTIDDQIKETADEITRLQDAQKGGFAANGAWADGQNNSAEIQQLEAVKFLLEGQKAAAEYATKAKQDLQKVQDDGASASAEQEQLLKSMKGTDAYTEAMTKELAVLKQIHDANPNSEQLKGITFDDQGNATGGDRLAQIEAFYHKKYDVKQKAAESEHKLDEEELAQEEAEEGVSYDQRLKFELNFWQEKLDAAKAGSKEYAQAYREVQTLQKQLDEQSARQADAAAKAELKSKLDAIDQLKTAYDGQAEVEKQQYQTQFDEGQISANQLAQLEKDLVARKLAADIAYLQAKEDLDRQAGQSGIDQANKEATAIEAAKQKAALDLAKIDDQQIRNSEKQWNQYGQQIAGSIKTAFNGMLFQGETLKQGMASVGETMAEDFIQAAIEKPLERWISAEAMKLQATIATLTGQSTATNAQRTADAAADAASSTASVARAAAVAGAQGTASFAAAPWPIDLGAPAFGVEMATVAASYTVPSMAGGWDQIPHDTLAKIHEDEMVLPAHFAGPLRDVIKNAGNGAQASAAGGDTHNWYITTMDGRSTEQFFRRNMGQLASAVKTKTRNSPQARRS